MTPEERSIRGADAKALLDNPMLQEAFVKVGEYIEGQALACNPDEKDRAQRIIITKQLLRAVEREITRVVEDGEVAKVQIAETEKRTGLKRFIR